MSLALVVLVAFMVEAAIGFGATLITVTFGAFLVPIEALLPAFVPLNLVLSSYLALRYRREVAWRVLLGRVLPLMGAGLPVGMALFRALGAGPLVKVFGAFVVVLAAVELVPRRRAGAGSPLVDGALLLLGGVVHGMFATGGPMAVYVLGRAISDKGAFRATLAVLWVVLNAVVVGGYLVGGQLGPALLDEMAMMALALAVGAALGERLHRAIPAERFRRAVFAALFVAGIVLLLR